MRHVLTISGFVLIAAAATNVMATPFTTRFIDSQQYSLDGGANLARTFGAAQLWVDGYLWVISKYTAGPKTGKVEWQNAFNGGVRAYDLNCNAIWPDFVGLGQYEDGGSLSLCAGGASTTCGAVYSGAYRPLGDGGLPFGQGGGERAGVALYDANGSTWVLAIKTASTIGSGGYCTGAGLQGGPAAVNKWVLLPLAANN